MRQLIVAAGTRILATARGLAANRILAANRTAIALPGGAAAGSVGTPDAVTLNTFTITVTDQSGSRLVTVTTTLTDPNIAPMVVNGYELELTGPDGRSVLLGGGIQTTFFWDSAPLTGVYSAVVRAWNTTGYSLDSNTLTDEPAEAIGTPTLIGAAQETAFGATTIVVTVPAGGVPQNATIAVALGRGSISGTPTCADSRGNTYTLRESLDNAVQGVYLFTGRASTALIENDTITVTYGAGTGVKQVVAAYCSGIHSTPVDVTDDKSGSDTSPTTDALVTTVADEWLVAAFTYGNTDGFAPGAGYTELAEQGSSQIKLVLLSRVVTATGSYTPNGTLTTSGAWVAAAVALKRQS